jgi:hypothetical protein
MNRSIDVGIAVAVLAFSLLLLPGSLQRIKVNTTSKRTLEINGRRPGNCYHKYGGLLGWQTGEALGDAFEL